MRTTFDTAISELDYHIRINSPTIAYHKLYDALIMTSGSPDFGKAIKEGASALPRMADLWDPEPANHGLKDMLSFAGNNKKHAADAIDVGVSMVPVLAKRGAWLYSHRALFLVLGKAKGNAEFPDEAPVLSRHFARTGPLMMNNVYHATWFIPAKDACETLTLRYKHRRVTELKKDAPDMGTDEARTHFARVDKEAKILNQVFKGALSAEEAAAKIKSRTGTKYQVLEL